MKQRKLINKFLGIFIALAVVLIVSFSLLSFFRYRQESLNIYFNFATDYAKQGAAYIDGDRVLGYLETGETDEYYDEVMDFMIIQLSNSSMLYYYVIVPEEDDFVYVWDADTSDEHCPLGWHEDYYEGGREATSEAFSKDPVVLPLYTSYAAYGDIVSLYYPIFDSSGDPVALMGVDLSIPGIYQLISQIVFLIIAGMFVITLIAIVLTFQYLKRTVISPIQLLNGTVLEMVDHIEQEEDIVIPIHTSDEIEELSHSFEEMQKKLKDYISELSKVTAEEERVNAELSVAAKIQSDMLPTVSTELSAHGGFDLFAHMTPAKEVGGDFYDFFLIDDDHLALLIADASGRGVPAAMFMVTAKTLLKNAAQSGLTPKEIFEKVNRDLTENNETGMFVTCWIGILTLSQGLLLCANAGHEYPIIKRKDGHFELYKDKHDFVLGAMEQIVYHEYELQLYAGDILFLYTDGVPEATSAQYELFETDRLVEALNKTDNASCEELAAQVRSDIDTFIGDMPQHDDMTILCLKFGSKRIASITVPVSNDQLSVVTDFVESHFKEWSVPSEIIINMNIAIDEMFSNIVKFSGASEAVITCSAIDNKACLRFEDNGTAFNPVEKGDADITLSAEDRGIGGLGIFIVKKSMDEMDYEYTDGKNILTLRKNL